MEVPCGQCMACRIERSRQWSMRIMHETQEHEISSFVTLTYDDDHLPPLLSLDKREAQLFIKRLRKSLGYKIRYYLCGEYGDKFKRPHFHAILFGYWPDDAQVVKDTPSGPLFSSASLSSLWGKGLCVLGSVTFESASYVAAYCTKKITGPLADVHYSGRAPEFALMSRRPGIGYLWYLKYRGETWRDDTVVIRGKEMKPPQAYKRLLQRDDYNTFRSVRNQRRLDTPHLSVDDKISRLKAKGIILETKQKLFKGGSL